MKLFTSHGPNPRVVDLFLMAKGRALETVWVDIGSAENRQDAFVSSVNPAGTTPVLELDDGSHLAEILPICEYLDECFPDPPLIGRTAQERAQTRMWTRRADLMICEPMASGFRFGKGLAMFQPRMRCLPEAAEGLQAVAGDGLRWFEAHAPGPWIAGERFTLADILLYVFVDFGNRIAGQPLPDDLPRLRSWFETVRTRMGEAGA